MPTYDYRCEQCGPYEVVESIGRYTGKDPCPLCGSVGDRTFVNNGVFLGESVQHAEYNPGLGCITKNAKHREEIAKRKGLVEIGNEKPREKFEKEKQAKRDKPYMTGNQLWHLKDNLR